MDKFHVVEMPYNSQGLGPEMDEGKVVGIDYEVWDEGFYSIATFDDVNIATYVASQYNKYWKSVNG